MRNRSSSREPAARLPVSKDLESTDVRVERPYSGCSGAVNPSERQPLRCLRSERQPSDPQHGGPSDGQTPSREVCSGRRRSGARGSTSRPRLRYAGPRISRSSVLIRAIPADQGRGQEQGAPGPSRNPSVPIRAIPTECELFQCGINYLLYVAIPPYRSGQFRRQRLHFNPPHG